MEKYTIKFKEPYKFEDKEYKELNLSGLKNLKTIDLIECQNNFTKNGNVDPLLEMNLGYCMQIASRVTNMPIEFFYGLPACYATAIKNRVSGFLLQTV